MCCMSPRAGSDRSLANTRAHKKTETLGLTSALSVDVRAKLQRRTLLPPPAVSSLSLGKDFQDDRDKILSTVRLKKKMLRAPQKTSLGWLGWICGRHLFPKSDLMLEPIALWLVLWHMVLLCSGRLEFESRLIIHPPLSPTSFLVLSLSLYYK